MDVHKVVLKAEKVTKNKIRFIEETTDGKPPVLESIYVPKWVVGDETEIEVTIGPKAKGKK